MGEKEYQNLGNEPAKIHFDFWLNDIDAENMFGCIQSSIVSCHANIMRLTFEKGTKSTDIDHDAYIKGYEGSAKYLEELEGKLKHKREE